LSASRKRKKSGVTTRNLFVLGQEWHLNDEIKKVYENETILSGISAGSICSFEEGLINPE